MSGRLKLRNAKGDLRWEVEDDSIDEWIADKIPDPPAGTLCEQTEKHEGHPVPPAMSWFWKISDGHVCYTYICEPCLDAYDFSDGADPSHYPTTVSGYAVTPRHCR